MKIFKRILTFTSALLLTMLCLAPAHVPVLAQNADNTYTNPQTGYEAAILDEYDLLTPQEESYLLYQMQELTAYGNIVFASGDDYFSDSDDYAASIFERRYGGDTDGTIFLIDMNNRVIQIHSWGTIYKIVTKGYATSITDNSYALASRGEYAACASKAFAQELELLKGHRIAQPMKLVSNILFALLAAILINYIVMRIVHRRGLNGNPELIKDSAVTVGVANVRVTPGKVSRQYAPVSSGSSGGSGGRSGGFGGGGFGGGGGGFSGGGGGHRF